MKYQQKLEQFSSLN